MKVKKFLIFHLTKFVFLTILIASCNRETGQQIVDKSFLSKKPCQAPCWYGLEIGVSTEDELLTTLKGLPFVDQESIRRVDGVSWPVQEAYAIQYACPKQSGHHCGLIGLVDGKIVFISHYLQYPLTLQEVISEVGTPEYLDYYRVGPERSGILVSFLWPEKRIIARTLIRNRNQIDALLSGRALPADLPIESITYSAPEGFERELEQLTWPGIME